MGKLTKALGIGAFLLAGIGINNASAQDKKDYFAELPMWHASGMAMVSGDFNNDGKSDLIVGVQDPYEFKIAKIYFFANRGRGNFSQGNYFTKLPMWHASGMALTAADFDGDKDLDLIVGVQNPEGKVARLYYFENDGKGNFILRQ